MDQASLSPSALLTAAACVLTLLWLAKPDKRLADLPSPKSTLPILGNTLDLMTFQLPRIYDWLADESARHDGRTWCLRLIGQPPVAVVSSIKAFEDVLKTQFEVFEKGASFRDVFRDALGSGIGAVDGDEWKAQRKVMSSMFTMRAFRETIADCIVQNVRALGRFLDKQVESHEPLDFGQTCGRFTHDTFTKVGFGIESNTLTEGVDDAIGEAMDAISNGIQMRLFQPTPVWKLLTWLGVGMHGDMMRHIALLDKVVYGIVDECLRRKSEAEKQGVEPQARKVNDIVSMFVDQYAQGSTVDKALKIDAAFLRDTGVTMLFAGRETTAGAMIWCNLMLNKYPKIAERIRQDLRTALPRLFEDPDYVPNMDEVDTLVYLDAFIRETLRLYPIAALNRREANRDTTLSDGTFITKGSQVYIPSYAIGRMTSVWGPDALEFKPERWIELDSNTNKPTIRKISAFQFPAFHGGPRICIGMRFAMLELKTALAYVLSKYELQTVKDPNDFTYGIALSLALKGPMLVNVLPVAKAS